MFWTDKIQLVISISAILILFPCLVAYSYKPLPSGVPFQMGLLTSGMDVLAAEIVILLLLALYFVCREYKTRPSNAVVFSKCIKGRYQQIQAVRDQQKLKVATDDKHIRQEHQSVAWEIMSKQKMIFE